MSTDFEQQVKCLNGLVTTGLSATDKVNATAQIRADGGIVTNSLHSTNKIISNKIMITPEGGIAIAMVNKTGSPSVKGTLVVPATQKYGVALVTIGDPDCIGVMYQDGIADGQNCWVVICGYADVFFVGNATIGQFARICATGDAGKEDGKAIAENLPTSPFATDKHFQEIRHVTETRTGAGLAGVILHFN